MEIATRQAYINLMRVRVDAYPQLRTICWNRRDDAILDGEDALALYERNWRFVDAAALDLRERRFIDRLVERYGRGVLMAD